MLLNYNIQVFSTDILTFYGCFRWIRPCGWRIGHPRTPAVALIILSPFQLCLPLNGLTAVMLCAVRLPVNLLMYCELPKCVCVVLHSAVCCTAFCCVVLHSAVCCTAFCCVVLHSAVCCTAFCCVLYCILLCAVLHSAVCCTAFCCVLYRILLCVVLHSAVCCTAFCCVLYHILLFVVPHSAVLYRILLCVVPHSAVLDLDYFFIYICGILQVLRTLSL